MLESAPGTVVAGVTLDDRSDVRTVHREIVEFASKRELPLHSLMRRSELPALIEQYQPDLCIVVGWYWLIPSELLNAVPSGFAGVHFSLLPAYRGSSPLVWALINGEEETGVSLFSLTEAVDAGDIWGQRRVAIGRDEYVGSVLARLEDEATSLVRDVYPRMITGDVGPEPQDHARATFCSPRTPEDGLIDWTWPAERIARFVRAQSRPYPGAFTHVSGERVTIWRATAGGAVPGAPGQIVKHDAEAANIVCGDQRALLVGEAQRGTTVGSFMDLAGTAVRVDARGGT
jgi:methionyl-tRNA formyltransferase